MRTRTVAAILIVALLTISPVMGMNGGDGGEGRSTDKPSGVRAPTAGAADVPDLLTMSPTAFTENRGQVENGDVRLYVRGGGLWFTDDGAWFDIREEVEGVGGGRLSGLDPMGRGLSEPPAPQEPVTRKGVVLKQEYVGCNDVVPVGMERLGWNSNFFYGNDPEGWRSDVPNYGEVWYYDLWDGIDLRYYTNEDGLKYDFIVHPGGDVGDIRIKWQGADSVEVGEKDVVIHTEMGDLTDGGLFVYQGDKEVCGLFIVEKSIVQISVEWYDGAKDLIIDPSLQYSTYITGGSSEDISYDVATDSTGNAYITGTTESGNFPTTPGVVSTTKSADQDIFVLKMNPSGTGLHYSTFIGGNNDEVGYSIDIDPSGNSYITGYAWSTDFPVTSGAYSSSNGGIQDIVVFKLNPTGTSLVYSTYVGGLHTDVGCGIKTDSQGNSYVTGWTNGDFPTTPGANDTIHNGSQDAIVLKLNSAGTDLIYSTYLGGIGLDKAYAITIDEIGNAYVTGHTTSIDFPTTLGANDTDFNGGDFPGDGFISKINQTGTTILFSTYIGGSDRDLCSAIALDSLGNTYVTGRTRSLDFPVTSGVYDTSHNGADDSFISKLNSTGDTLLYSTFIGGSGSDQGYGIEVDPNGYAYVVGYAGSGFPLTSDAYDTTVSLTEPVFFIFNPTGTSLHYSTYFGGSGVDIGLDISLDEEGYVVFTGKTSSTDFHVTPGVLGSTGGPSYEAYITKFILNDFISIDSMGLFRNGNEESQVYSRLDQYTFRTNITDTASLADPESVTLTLDPDGEQITYYWNQTTGLITKLTDIHDYTTLEPSSRAYHDGLFTWTLEFNVTFNWEYPDELLHDVRVNARSRLLPDKDFTFQDVYQVENDIGFRNSDYDFTVYDSGMNKLKNMELVKGGENLTFTGIVTVYEQTTDVYPPSGEYIITVGDEIGNYGHDSPQPGEPMFIQMNAPNITWGEHIFTVNYTGPPSWGNKTGIELNIDADAPRYSNPIPDPNIWQLDEMVDVGVRVQDHEGALVDGDTIELATSTNNGTIWSEWIRTPYPSSYYVDADASVQFEDGWDNRVKWRASDTLGNGPSESPTYTVLVDTTEVEFANPFPPDTAVSNSRNVTVAIEITDATSGVNASSVEFQFMYTDDGHWSAWLPAEGVTEYDDHVHVEMSYWFPNGTNSYIRWRAKDIAGNGPAESIVYVINVNAWVAPVKPEVRLLAPENGATVNGSEVDLTWELVNTSKEGVLYKVVLDPIETDGVKLPGPVTTVAADLEDTTYLFQGLDNGMTYYWTVIPVSADGIEGTCVDGVWTFTVHIADPPPDWGVTVDPIEPIEMFPGDVSRVYANVTNTGRFNDRFTFLVDGGTLGTRVYITSQAEPLLEPGGSTLVEITITLEDSAVSADTYPVVFTAISLGARDVLQDVSANTSFAVHVPSVPYEPPPTTEDPNEEKEGTTINWLWVLAIIAIAIVAIVVVVMFMRMRGKKDGGEDEELSEPGATIAVDIVQPGTPRPLGPIRVTPAEVVDVDAGIKTADGKVLQLTKPVEPGVPAPAPGTPQPQPMATSVIGPTETPLLPAHEAGGGVPGKEG